MDRIERAVCKKMEPVLKPHGFELDKELGGFVRRQPYGHDAMLVVNQGSAGAVGPRHFEIKFYFDIRHDCVEVPWNTLGMVYGEEAQRITPTLTLHPRPRNLPSLKVIPASQDEDTSRIAQEGAALFRDKGLPFFAEFANLSIVEALANRHPLIDLHPYNFGGPMEHRAMRSLILAKIVNPGRYAQVRETFVTLDKGMFPREQRMAMLAKVDAMELPRWQA